MTDPGERPDRFAPLWLAAALAAAAGWLPPLPSSLWLAETAT